MTDQKIKQGSVPSAAPAPPETARTIPAKLIDSVEVALDGFLGTAHLTVGELGALKQGSVVPLDAALNAAVELRLNGAAVARGELVAVGDSFAIRLTEIAS